MVDAAHRSGRDVRRDALRRVLVSPRHRPERPDTATDTLVEHGVLAKEPYQDNPVRYDYRLTEKGRDLWTVLAALRQWGDKWTAEDGAPVVSTHSCGQTMTVEPTCSACGERIAVGDLRVHAGPGATAANPLKALR